MWFGCVHRLGSLRTLATALALLVLLNYSLTAALPTPTPNTLPSVMLLASTSAALFSTLPITLHSLLTQTHAVHSIALHLPERDARAFLQLIATSNDSALEPYRDSRVQVVFGTDVVGSAVGLSQRLAEEGRGEQPLIVVADGRAYGRRLVQDLIEGWRGLGGSAAMGLAGMGAELAASVDGAAGVSGFEVGGASEVDVLDAAEGYLILPRWLATAPPPSNPPDPAQLVLSSIASQPLTDLRLSHLLALASIPRLVLPATHNLSPSLDLALPSLTRATTTSDGHRTALLRARQAGLDLRQAEAAARLALLPSNEQDSVERSEREGREGDRRGVRRKGRQAAQRARRWRAGVRKWLFWRSLRKEWGEEGVPWNGW